MGDLSPTCPGSILGMYILANSPVCVIVQLAPPGDTTGEDLPPCELPSFDVKDRGPVMPVPKGIRPTLSRHRIEVRPPSVREAYNFRGG